MLQFPNQSHTKGKQGALRAACNALKVTGAPVFFHPPLPFLLLLLFGCFRYFLADVERYRVSLKEDRVAVADICRLI